MTFKKNIYLNALQFAFFDDNYEKNFDILESLINKCEKNSLVVAPELCLTNFSFSHLDKASLFGEKSLKKLLEMSKDKIISFTMTKKIDNQYFNMAYLLYKNKILHSQPKYKLFKFGDEDKYFTYGSLEQIKIVEVNGLKIAILICFEIRFIELWKKIKGADIILIPALWGKLRKDHFKSITKTLAIINQAYVVASNSSNSDMASSSGIISPFGEEIRDDNANIISINANLNEIKKMRRYMDIGLNYNG